LANWAFEAQICTGPNDLEKRAAMPIENVSDTARWVAVYRAMESDRRDAIFRDPFARRLAGAKGQEIVDSMPRGTQAAWAMIVRTAVFDEIILDRVAAGVDCVLNLAAGLDARAWRMSSLPPTLRWIDVDLPGILDYKADMLRDEKPVVRYEAVKVDLTDAARRRALFAQVGAESSRVLVLSEGLLIYLAPDDVAGLARDLHDPQSFRWWVIDLASPMLLKWMSRSWGKRVDAANAPFRFAPEESTKFFEPYGWREEQFRSSWLESKRLNRQMPLAWLWTLVGKLRSRQTQEGFARFSGIVLLQRT
jgi:methyltransferase (TIGR00027 family)